MNSFFFVQNIVKLERIDLETAKRQICTFIFILILHAASLCHAKQPPPPTPLKYALSIACPIVARSYHIYSFKSDVLEQQIWP